MEIKDYNVLIDGRNFFDQPIKRDLKTYFKTYYKLIAIDLSKQQKLNAVPKAIQQINFTGNLDRAEGGTTIFFIIEEAKETVLYFSKGAVKVLRFYFNIALI